MSVFFTYKTDNNKFIELLKPLNIGYISNYCCKVKFILSAEYCKTPDLTLLYFKLPKFPI